MEVRPGYKMTEVGVIPEDWATAHLPDVVWYQEGPGVRNYQFKNAGVKLFNGTNIENGRIFLDKTSRYISEREAYGWYSHFLADAGDIVIACSGITVSRFDEKVSVLSSEHLPLCMNTSTMRFKIASPRLHKDYFRHFLRSQLFKDQISGKATGSAQLNFGPAHVSAAFVPLPTKAEQEAIAEALSDADALIESLEQLTAKKRELEQGAMQELLTGNKRLPGFSGEWEVKRLGRLAEIVMGQSPSSAYYNNQGDGLPLIQGNADISGRQTVKRVFTAEVTKRGRTGDILMSVRAPVGEVSRAVFDVCLGRGVCGIRYPNDFLYYALIAKEPTWSRLSKGSTFDSVNSTDVKAFEIEVPADELEQTAIAAILSDMDAEIAALEVKLTKTRQLKQGMMQELLTGRIRLV